MVGDLGPSCRHRGDQGRLAGAREADQADVGDALELEDEIARLTWLAEQREAGSLAPHRRQRSVAETAAPAVCRHETSAGAGEIGQHFTRLVHDDGAVGHPQRQVAAFGAVAMTAGTLLAVAGVLVGMVMEVEQRVHVRIDDEDDVTAVPAVAAVWSAERFELLAVNGGDAVTSVAGGQVQHDAVDERHGDSLLSASGRVTIWSSWKCEGRAPVTRARPCGELAFRSGDPQTSTGTMFTVLRPRERPNWTLPLTRANSVSSPPRPT